MGRARGSPEEAFNTRARHLHRQGALHLISHRADQWPEVGLARLGPAKCGTRGHSIGDHLGHPHWPVHLLTPQGRSRSCPWILMGGTFLAVGW